VTLAATRSPSFHSSTPRSIHHPFLVSCGTPFAFQDDTSRTIHGRRLHQHFFASWPPHLLEIRGRWYFQGRKHSSSVSGPHHDLRCRLRMKTPWNPHVEHNRENWDLPSPDLSFPPLPSSNIRTGCRDDEIQQPSSPFQQRVWNLLAAGRPYLPPIYHRARYPFCLVPSISHELSS
jgi:hypothetical protein